MSEYPFDAQSPQDPRAEAPTGAPTPDAPLDDAPTTDVRTPSEASAGAPSQASASAATSASQDGSAAQGAAPVPGAPVPPGSAAQTQARPRTQVPPAPEAGPAHAAGARSAGPLAAPSVPGPSEPRRPRSTMRAILAGLLGGVVGAAALVGVLGVTGVVSLDKGTVTGGTAQSVTIDPNDEDTTVANAVAAKALPSVCTVYCTYPDGSGMGSGVIYDTDGNIITNNHVIENAESISVAYNGKSYDATLVGTDPSSDVAVIHADFGEDDVTPMEVGDSASLQVGDWVMSVGSPFGLENSVSQGIVSALSRNTLLENSEGNTLYTNLIQTDATINPGNSGGALVDAEGRLVGICTLFSSDTESFAGIGYAIPGNYATEIADKIIAGEDVTHAYIGLTMQTVTPQNAFRNSLSVDEGAYVVEVTEGGPAAEAGIQEGDVITAIGDTKITSADAAILAVRSHSIGETVSVTVMRGSEEKTLDVTLGSDEALQDAREQQNQTVNVNGQEISIEDLIRLYEQYQEQQQYQQHQQMDPFGGR